MEIANEQNWQEWKTTRQDAIEAVIKLVDEGTDPEEAIKLIIANQYTGIDPEGTAFELYQEIVQPVECDICGAAGVVEKCGNCGGNCCKTHTVTLNKDGGVEYCFICYPEFIKKKMKLTKRMRAVLESPGQTTQLATARKLEKLGIITLGDYSIESDPELPRRRIVYFDINPVYEKIIEKVA